MIAEVRDGDSAPADPGWRRATRADDPSRHGAFVRDGLRSVRVHHGPEAARSAAAFRARAYTVGEDIVLGEATADRRTIAHELTHVVQQRAGPVDGTPIGGGVRVSDPADRCERAAEATADRVIGGVEAPRVVGGSQGMQRQAEAPDEEEEAPVETLPLQRQAEAPEEEEEAPVETLPLQRQAEAPEEEEEAPVETLPLQRQAEDDRRPGQILLRTTSGGEPRGQRPAPFPIRSSRSASRHPAARIPFPLAETQRRRQIRNDGEAVPHLAPQLLVCPL